MFVWTGGYWRLLLDIVLCPERREGELRIQDLACQACKRGIAPITSDLENSRILIRPYWLFSTLKLDSLDQSGYTRHLYHHCRVPVFPSSKPSLSLISRLAFQVSRKV